MAEAAAHAAIIAQAIKASGAIVRVEPEDFQRLVGRMEDPVVVIARRSFFGERFQYLTSYKGLILYTKTSEPIGISGRAEIIAARSIWVPQ
ncbi:MAG: hypothetical protein HY700_09215 [Gemmatimonadetes bacterium]|nr:hypothetical protein [Gemmatimonadota bacterium]